MKTQSEFTKVFLSVGSAFTQQQSDFIKAFEDFLLRNSCQPHTIGQSVYSATQPVLRARQEMKACDGAIILAFARYEIEEGTEYPKSRKSKPIAGMKLPTVWNQLEGGMAYGLDLPILILIEEGLKQQGILGNRSEWFPQMIELSTGIFEDQAFRGVFEDWKRLTRERADGKEKAAQKAIAGLTMYDLLKGIGIKAGLNVMAALGGALGAAFGAGYWVAQKFGG
jgi:hypothetical protein